MLVKKYLSGIAFFLTLSFYSVPLEAVIDTGVSRLSFKAVTGSFIESNKTGQLFVIRGQVANNYGTTRRFILLEANILDDKGHVVTSKSVYAGNAFTESEIKGMSLEEIDDASTNPYVKGNVNVSIRPGGVVPFVIIFKNLPENLSEFTVQAISSSPGEISADQGKTTAEEEIEKKIRRIAEQFEEASQREIPEQIRIKGGRLNVRSGPGTTYPVVCTVKLNNIFVAQEKARGWIRIQVDSNTAGWVFEKYVEYLSPDTKSGQVQEPKSESPSTTQETSVVKPAPTGAPETVAPVTTMSRPIFASAAKKLLLITLIVSIFAFSIINRKLGLKHWWIFPLISLMVLAFFLPGMLADLHYELDESMKLLLVLGCLIGAIAIAYISESRWIFVLLLFGGLPVLMLAHKIIGVWIGTILLFLIIWVYGLFIRKLDEKTKSEKASIIIKNAPIIIVGLSYIVVAGWVIIQRLVTGNLVSHVILHVMWIFLGITLIYKRKFAIILSLISYPGVFALNIFSQPIIGNISFLTPLLYTPFHHISFIILQKYALLSTVKPYWTAYLWGIYVIHSICLLPYLFKRRKRVHKPQETFLEDVHIKIAERPGWVSFFAVWQFIVALFSLILGAGLVLESEKGEYLGFGIFFIILGSLGIAVGHGLLNLKNWARITIIIKSIPELLLFPIIGTIISGATIYYFARKKTKSYFIHEYERKPKEEKEAKPELLPVFTSPYETNPFRVLGLRVNASLGQISSRASELKTRISLGLDINKIVVPLPGAEKLDIQMVNEALSMVQDPKRRIKQELFWYNIESGEDEEALSYLIMGNLDKAESIWKELVGTDRVTGAHFLHNLSVLTHTISIGHDFELKKENPGRKQLSKEEIKHWKETFSLWKKVQADSNTWAYLKKRVMEIDHPRLTNKELKQLRQDFPRDLLHFNSQIAVQAIRVGWLNYAKQHISLIKGSGFKEDIQKDALFLVISDKINELRGYREQVERKIKDENTDFIRIGEKLIRSVLKVKDAVTRLDSTLMNMLSQEIDKIGLLLERTARIHRSEGMEDLDEIFKEAVEFIEGKGDPWSLRYLQKPMQDKINFAEKRLTEAEKLLLDTSEQIPLSDIVTRKLEKSIKQTGEDLNIVEKLKSSQ